MRRWRRGRPDGREIHPPAPLRHDAGDEPAIPEVAGGRELRVVDQIGRQHAAPPLDLAPPLPARHGNLRHRHPAVAEVPPLREHDVWPWHRLVVLPEVDRVVLVHRPGSVRARRTSFAVAGGEVALGHRCMVRLLGEWGGRVGRVGKKMATGPI